METTAIQTQDSLLSNKEVALQRLQESSTAIEVVHNFIAEKFILGTDYGKPATAPHMKEFLHKPGAEKLVKMFGLRADFEVDKDLQDLFNDANERRKTVCILCKLVDRTTGEIIGTGRGAEKLGNLSRDENSTLKIAQKRALVDAVLYTFALSSRFTQDGGASQNDLQRAKLHLLELVEEKRAGIESELTNNKWIAEVCKIELHRRSINTLGQCKSIIAKVEAGCYDWATAKQIKDPAADSPRQESANREPIPPTAPDWLQLDGDAPNWEDLKHCQIINGEIEELSKSRGAPTVFRCVIGGKTYQTSDSNLAQLMKSIKEDLLEVKAFVDQNEIKWVQGFQVG